MKVDIIETTGITTALMGLGLSYGLTSNMDMVDFIYTTNYDKCLKIADALAHKQRGHNKFLETITIYLDITAPRYWWCEFDTYRVGVTKQSESTIHTITKRTLTQGDFQQPIDEFQLTRINYLIDRYNREGSPSIKNSIFAKIKNNLPEGFLQRRIVVLNAKTLQNIIAQRINHRLPEWKQFCDTLRNSLPFHVCSWVFPEGHTAE